MASLEYGKLIWTPDQNQIEAERDWINTEIKNISLRVLKNLAKSARNARELSYSDYSHYKVGAALLTTKGEKVLGQNIEIATYSETGHAEEQAAKNAISLGLHKKEGRKFIRAIAVSHKEDTAPCGRCRQIIAEFSDDCLVIIADEKGDIKNITSSRLLLPYAFTPSDLGKD